MTREIERAIEDEVAKWPGASVTIEKGKGHPKAKLEFGGLIMRRVFPGTPSSRHSITKTLHDVRRSLKDMGAAREGETSDKEDDEIAERIYRPPNPGREKRPDPVEREPAAVKPTIGDQIEGLGLEGSRALVVTPAVPINQEAREIVHLEPLGPGEWDIDEDRYHSDPCPEPSLSSSIAKKMIEFSPYHGWHAHPRLNPGYEAPDKLIHRIGRAFHAKMLGKGAPVEVYDYPNWKTDAAKADRDQALKDGLTPLLPHQDEKIEAMVRAAKRQMARREEVAFAMAGGIPERVYIWVEETDFGPIYCRMMVDWTPHGGRYPLDFKTTGQSAETWGQRTLWDVGFDIQDAFYRRGFKKVLGIEYDALVAVVTETVEPHGLMHHRVMPESQAAAEMEVKWAIRAFAMCKARGRWPGYPTDMAWQEKPGWRAQRTEQRYEGTQRDLEALDETLRQLESMRDIAPREDGEEVTADNPFGLKPLPADADERDELAEMLDRASQDRRDEDDGDDIVWDHERTEREEDEH